MDKELKPLLQQILANQAILYKKLCDIEDKQHNRTKMASIQSYADKLKEESDNLLKQYRTG